MKLKSTIFALFFVLSMSSSFANVSAPKLAETELNTEIFSSSTSSVVLEAYDDLCKWYTVTTIKTTSYFILGVWVGSSVETETTIECR